MFMESKERVILLKAVSSITFIAPTVIVTKMFLVVGVQEIRTQP
jgi:hypothetical protein